MWLEQGVLDELHPFSFLTNEEGIVCQAGRSFEKLYRSSPVGVHFKELGVVAQPAVLNGEVTPEKFIGESLSVKFSKEREVLLRGHVVRLGAHENFYIFALQPAIAKTEQVTMYGLELSDFEIATPVFDNLLFLHSQARAQAKLREANKQLLLDVSMSKLLLKVVLEAFRDEDATSMYHNALAAVTRELAWDIGHVFFCEPEPPHSLVSSDIWVLSDPRRYDSFISLTNSIDWSASFEFPVFVPSRGGARWIADYRDHLDGSGGRAIALSGETTITAVGIPVIQGGTVVAVIELISEKPQTYSETALSFFSLLGVQLGYALAHHESKRKERTQLAALAYASKMATLGEIVAGVAHEINNPVSTISLIVRILKRYGAEGESALELLKEQLPKIDLCVDRISQIVRELRDFSRESSRDPFQPVLLQKIISDTVDLCSARFKARGVALELPECLGELVIECRFSQISQILLNLLNNAFDAAVEQPAKWVRIECFDSGEAIDIAVCDSGAGIALKDRDKIMSPFFTTKPPGHGTGLGLSISANIAVDHGGELRLDTKAPYTRFVLALPKRQKDASHVESGTHPEEGL